MNLDKTLKSLALRGFGVKYFDKGAAAAEYVAAQIDDGCSVGIGGSKTVEAIGLYEMLIDKQDVAWHWRVPGRETLIKEILADYFICSANAITEDGQILNIDGNGNRIAATLFGHKKVFIIAGTNKICPDYDSALYRARNTAAVTNARRFDYNIPCKLDNKRHDCRSPERICKALTVLWGPMFNMETEVIIVDEELGY